MSTKKDLKVLSFDLLDERIEPEREGARRPKLSIRRMRRVNPLGMRVVVELIQESNMTDAGLYLPDGAKQALQESVLAEVVEVAMCHDERTGEDTNISGIPQGARVLIPKSAGLKVPWDDSLRIVETKDVLAVVDELSLV